jgi:hypothetical protein
MNVTDRIEEALSGLAEQNILGPFTLTMPSAIAAQLARELKVDFSPDENGHIEYKGHRIICEDKIHIGVLVP